MEWLISINLGLLYQVAIQAVTFLVFFFLVKKLFFDKVSDMMEKRKALIEGDLQDAQTASENAKKLEETYNEKITNIESERYDIMKKAAKDGEVVKERIIADAHGEADQIIASAKREIEIQRKRAEDEFKDSIVDLTIEAAEKVVGKSLNKEDHLKLITDSISQFKEV